MEITKYDMKRQRVRISTTGFARLRRTVLLGIALLGMAHSAPAADPTGDKQVKRFAEAVQARGTEVMEYLADKIRNNYIVGLGEDHWIKDHPQFLCEILRTMAQDSTVHIDVLAVEFGNQADQPLADSLVASPTYRHDLAIKILRNAPDDVGNPYKEYADIFRTVWEVNRLKPESRRTRILLLDPPFVLDALDGKPYKATGSRDDTQTNLLRWELIDHKHVVFYCGLGHVARRIWGQYIPDTDSYYNWPSTGHLLKALYPGQVCLLEIWGGMMGSNGYIPRNDDKRWERLYGGLFDDAFRLNGNRPVGFDLEGPAFDTLTVARHFTTPETYDKWDVRAGIGAPYRKTDRLCDYVDGMLFFRPVETFGGATVIEDLYDDAFVRRVSERNGGKYPTRKAIYEYIRESHPMMHESLDVLIEKEKVR